MAETSGVLIGEDPSGDKRVLRTNADGDLRMDLSDAAITALKGPTGDTGPTVESIESAVTSAVARSKSLG